MKRVRPACPVTVYNPARVLRAKCSGCSSEGSEETNENTAGRDRSHVNLRISCWEIYSHEFVDPFLY